MRRASIAQGAFGLHNVPWQSLAAVAAAGVLLLLPLYGSEPLVIQTIDSLVFVLFAASLNLLVGYAGMVSMGHAAFFALGGYGSGLLSKLLGVPMPLAMVAGAGIASLAAAVIGFFSIRLTQAYFIMLTLAFAQLVYLVIWKWPELTGGDDGLIGLMPASWLIGNEAYYYFTLVIVSLSLILLYKISEAPFGRILMALRDNPGRTAFIGVNVRLCQWIAFIIAGTFAGIAGALQAFFHRGMFVESAHFSNSTDVLTVVVLGGVHSFFGPILGAVLFKVLSIIIPTATVYWPFFLGVVILVIIFALPDGLIGKHTSLGLLRHGRTASRR